MSKENLQEAPRASLRNSSTGRDFREAFRIQTLEQLNRALIHQKNIFSTQKSKKTCFLLNGFQFSWNLESAPTMRPDVLEWSTNCDSYKRWNLTWSEGKEAGEKLNSTSDNRLFSLQFYLLHILDSTSPHWGSLRLAAKWKENRTMLLLNLSSSISRALKVLKTVLKLLQRDGEALKSLTHGKWGSTRTIRHTNTQTEHSEEVS